MRVSQSKKKRIPEFSFQMGALASLFASAAVVIALGFGAATLYVRLFYIGAALPGVQAAGVPLGGMSSTEIETEIQKQLTYPETGLIVLHDKDQLWTLQPSELGVTINFPMMAQEALAVGRQGDILTQLVTQWKVWFSGRTIQPIVNYEQDKGAEYLTDLAERINRSQVEASLGVNGVQIEMRPGQIGRKLDIPSTLQALSGPISKLYDAKIDLVVEESPPLFLDVSEQAALAKSILGEPLILTSEAEGPWTFEPKALAEMLQFVPIEQDGEATYKVGLDPGQLASALEPLAEQLKREVENARFIFNDDTRELDLLKPAVTGRSLDIPASIRAIQEALNEDVHEVPLIFAHIAPEVQEDATASDLGIREAVSVVSSYFSGSGSARAQNIRTAASAFHGLLVAPGETLSMAEVLGDISLDTGYAEALIIYGDRTIKGVGGGVCQVSTTLFRTAFWGGYPLVERHPHAYRVGYYELGANSPGPGLDATVFVPIVDFKFTNDSPNWLLLETYIYGDQLLWKFYSTSDGRKVEWDSQVSNKVEAPEPLYKKNPDLPEGKIRQIEWEADGLDVRVTRTVMRDGEILHSDVINTHYLPWRAIFEYGPGTELPEDAITETPDSQ